MEEIKVYDKDGNQITMLVQWDLDIYIYIKNDKITTNHNVHFFNSESDVAYVVPSTYEDGILCCKIPNRLLFVALPITGYIYITEDNDSYRSTFVFNILVRSRAIPSDFMYIPDAMDDYISAVKVLAWCEDYAMSACQCAADAEDWANLSKSWAVGDTGVRDGEDTDNSKYYCQEAATSASNAATSEKNAKTSETNAKTSENNAKSSADAAAESAEKAAVFDGSLYALKKYYADNSMNVGREDDSDSGYHSFAVGDNVIASGMYSHAEGFLTEASGNSAHAEGHGLNSGLTTASGDYSHAEGVGTKASGNYSHAEGYQTKAIGEYSHAEGYYTEARGEYSHAEGSSSCAVGYYSHAEGTDSYSGPPSDASYDTQAAHAEGYETAALRTGAHSEGVGTTAEEVASHAEGYYTKASAAYAHAEGHRTAVEDFYAHAEGSYTEASGPTSHAEGYYTIAEASFSHAEGSLTKASTYYSHASGYNTNTGGAMCQTAIGHSNKISTTSGAPETTTGDAFIIGNGISSDNSGNAFRVSFGGSVYTCSGGSYNSSSADYAEFIKEWADGNQNEEDRVGYFVTIKDGYLYKADAGEYIVGITSGNPAVVGNSDEDYFWKYERDEFGRVIYDDVEEEIIEPIIEIPYNEDDSENFDSENTEAMGDEAEPLDNKETEDENIEIREDENGCKYKVTKTGNIIKDGIMVLSENYDQSLQSTYIERKDRPEWDYVGMMGVIPVRDDGTCQEGSFCKCGGDGIATYAEERGFDTYYVIERVSDNVVSVIMR